MVGNDSLVRELAYTARNMYADEALKLGLVSSVLDTRQHALDAAFVSNPSAVLHCCLGGGWGLGLGSRDLCSTSAGTACQKPTVTFFPSIGLGWHKS